MNLYQKKNQDGHSKGGCNEGESCGKKNGISSGLNGGLGLSVLLVGRQVLKTQPAKGMWVENELPKEIGEGKSRSPKNCYLGPEFCVGPKTENRIILDAHNNL